MSTPAVIQEYQTRYALTVPEAAHALGVCRASIYNMLNRGELTAVKFGRSTRIPVTEIQRVSSGGDAS